MTTATNKPSGWPDARGWIAIASFAMAVMVLWMMKIDRALREDEFFQTIATVVIANGWLAVVAWAFSATKGGGEQAASNAVIAEKLAEATTTNNKGPQKVEVVQPPERPVPVEAAPDEELPEYARG